MSGPYREIDHKVAEPPVGITTGSNDDGIEYVCAAGVTKFGRVPKNCIKLPLPPATYVVFAHDGHVTQTRETYEAIWNNWFPKRARKISDGQSIILALRPPRREILTKCQSQTYGSEARLPRRGPAQ